MEKKFQMIHIYTCIRTLQVDIAKRDNVNVYDARMSTRKANVEKIYKIDLDDVALKRKKERLARERKMSGWAMSEKTLRDVKCVNGVYVPFGWNRFWRSS